MTESKRVALVTGAGSGVGRHSSLALLEAGFHLVMISNQDEGVSLKKPKAEAEDVTPEKEIAKI